MNKQYARDALREQVRCVLHDSYVGFMSFAHSSLTLVGLTALLVTTLLMTQPDLRNGLQKLVTLQARDEAATADQGSMSSNAVNQLADSARQYAAQTSALLGLNGVWDDNETISTVAATAISDVKSPALNKQQKGMARYLSGKYRLNPTAVELLVIAAHETGKEAGLEPSLLLAVMAVESGFNPFAQSAVGAQGVMQVMAKVHADKLDDFGGANAALNPVANLQVGALILKDCIRRSGSVQAGLRLYVGAGLSDDGGYGEKVLQEKQRIDLAGRGVNPPLNTAAVSHSSPATTTAASLMPVALPKAPANASQPTAIESEPHAEVRSEPKV
jgi:hypothetical protein